MIHRFTSMSLYRTKSLDITHVIFIPLFTFLNRVGGTLMALTKFGAILKTCLQRNRSKHFKTVNFN